MYQSVDQHTRDAHPIIQRLVRSGRSDASVISLILTEMYFRPPAMRLLELILWKMMALFGFRRRHSVTIGLAQLQARHWIHLIPRFDSLTLFSQYDALFSPNLNYDVCCGYFASIKPPARPDVSSFIAAYVGETRGYYLSIYLRVLAIISTISDVRLTCRFASPTVAERHMLTIDGWRS